MIESESDVQTLLQALETGDQEARRSARQAASKKVLPFLMGRLDDDDPRIRKRAAHALEKLGLFGAESISRLTRLLEEPDPILQAAAANALEAVHGRILYRQGVDQAESDKVMNECTSILAMDNEDFATYVRRAILRTQREDLLGAIADSTHAIELDPDNIPALLVRGEARSDRGGIPDGVEDCARAIQLCPSNPFAYESRGRVRMNIKDYEGAAADFTRSIELYSRSVEAYLGRADAFDAIGRKDVAMEDYGKALEVAPADWPIREKVAAWVKDYASRGAPSSAYSRIPPSPKRCSMCGKPLLVPEDGGRYRCDACNVVYDEVRDSEPRPIAVRRAQPPRECPVPDVGFETFPVHWDFAPQDLERIKWGYVPQVMEEKWAIVADGDQLFFHRSWTGMLCFVARFAERGVREVRVSLHFADRPGQIKLIRALTERLLVGKKWPSPDIFGIDFKSRLRGALLGLAAGDALGTTLEFQPPGTFEPVQDIIGGGPFHLKPGEWTDDTSMALCLAESLIEKKGFDPIDQLERYVKWWRSGHLSSNGRCLDIGNTVHSALLRFEETRESYCGNEDPRSAGNGSIMRLAPVAMAYVQNPGEAMERCAESSRTTHRAIEAVDACRYFGGLLVGALRGVPRSELLSARYSPVPGYWDKHPLAPAIEEIALGSFKSRRPPEIKGTGYVVRSLEAALWAFWRSRSFREGCLYAVNLGDDADTTGAIYGQLAGAFYGEEGIPEKWRSRLAHRSLIESMAEKLRELGQSL